MNYPFYFFREVTGEQRSIRQHPRSRWEPLGGAPSLRFCIAGISLTHILLLNVLVVSEFRRVCLIDLKTATRKGSLTICSHGVSQKTLSPSLDMVVAFCAVDAAGNVLSHGQRPCQPGGCAAAGRGGAAQGRRSARCWRGAQRLPVLQRWSGAPSRGSDERDCSGPRKRLQPGAALGTSPLLLGPLD